MKRKTQEIRREGEALWWYRKMREPQFAMAFSEPHQWLVEVIAASEARGFAEGWNAREEQARREANMASKSTTSPEQSPSGPEPS